MMRVLCFLLVLNVVAWSGCGKKEADAPAAAASTPTRPAEAPAAPKTATTTAQPANATPAPMAEPARVPGELPIIAKARAYVGSETALSAVTSIHYFGTLTTSDPNDPKKQTRAVIEIVLQKPDRQRFTITSDKTIEVSALNGYEGWTRTTAVDDPTKWQQTLLGVEGVKILRANTWENLAYYRGLEADGGRVEDNGTTTIDGIECERVAFIHTPNIIFYRNFDRTTGRVVLTETQAGWTIREQGEIIVKGVRFPKSIITVAKNTPGQAQTLTMSFDKILVNEDMPPEYFAVPTLKNK